MQTKRLKFKKINKKKIQKTKDMNFLTELTFHLPAFDLPVKLPFIRQIAKY